MVSNMCKGDKWPLGVVTAFFMLTVGVSTILALTVSQQAAYLWLSFVLIGILFLTTFTRNSRTPSIPYDSGYERRPSEHMRACGRFVERSGSGPVPPYFVRIDPPPSYNAAITIYPDTCEPPPYINVVIQNSSSPNPTACNQALLKGIQIPPGAEPLPILHHLETSQHCCEMSAAQTSADTSTVSLNETHCSDMSGAQISSDASTVPLNETDQPHPMTDVTNDAEETSTTIIGERVETDVNLKNATRSESSRC